MQRAREREPMGLMRALVLLGFFALGALAAAGCSALDDFNGFTFNGEGQDLGGAGHDLSRDSHDLSMMMSGCTLPNQRVCIDSVTSGVCGMPPIADRNCPPGSMCQGGFCKPPTGASPCQSNNDCNFGEDCDLYVGAGGNSLQGFCTSDGGGTADVGTPCSSPGSDPTCNSGLCAVDAFDQLVVECLFPCNGGGDCPFNGNCRNLAAPLTIEGVSTAAVQGCFQ